MKKRIIILMVIAVMLFTSALLLAVDETTTPDIMGIKLNVILSWAITLGSAIFGLDRWRKFKGLLRKLSDLTAVINAAAADDKISEDELKAIMAGGKNVFTAIMDLFAKKKGRS